MTCPVTGCTVDVEIDRLMCRPHWFMVPKDLRAEVWRAWKARLSADDSSDRARQRAARERHEHVKAAAIKAVNERVA